MDSLDAAAAALIAGWLPDERDLASLRCTNRFWRDALSNNPGLWSRLLASRFGTPAPTSHGSPTPQPASSSGSSAAMSSSAPGSPVAADPERRFRQLATAALQRPTAGLERLIWLDGSHLQRIDDPSSPYGTTVRVSNVWWLELGGRLHGVLPGRYRLAWRLRLEPAAALEQLHLIARQERPDPWAGGSGAAHESVQDWEWTLDDAAITASRALALAEVMPAGLFRLAQAVSVAGPVQQARTWTGWFEVVGEPFEVPELCNLWVELRETRRWKGGIVVESVRLVRQQAQQQAQQAQQQGQAEQAGDATAAGVAEAGRQASGSSVWARLRRAARGLGLPR